MFVLRWGCRMGGGALCVACTGERSGDVEGEGERTMGVVDVDHLLRARFRVYREHPAQEKSNL